MQSIDLIETDAYGTSKDLLSEKREIKCNNKCKKWLTLWCFKRRHKKHNPNWPQLLINYTEY